MNPREKLEEFIVTADQMQAIERRMFAAGLPVAALMEKVAGLMVQQLQPYLSGSTARVGILAGPGHNGGDALVIARELFFQGHEVVVYCPFSKRRTLTEEHLSYVKSLGIPVVDTADALKNCQILIDGLFGFGLDRAITGGLATTIAQINRWQKTVFSIDLPSGLQTDTGEAFGIAVRATRTFCLGLWKLAFFQDQALEFIGESELIDFDIPLGDILAVVGESPDLARLTTQQVIKGLPLPRDPASHKYKNGHLLIIAGSARYAGAAILTALGARASGVGMLTLAVPEPIKFLLNGQLPEALVIGCSTNSVGGIQALPEDVDLDQYDAIACGPGLTQTPMAIVEQVLKSTCPLVLDADGLNILAQLNPIATLAQRSAPTVITPHPGEFKRLFPEISEDLNHRILTTQKASHLTSAIVVLKGARTCVGSGGRVWVNPTGTPALARGGSGDVLTGLLGGLLAANILRNQSLELTTQAAVWWHAQAGLQAALERTELGVDAVILTQYLNPVLMQIPI